MTRANAPQDEASRTDGQHAPLDSTEPPHPRLAAYVRSVIADLKPKSNATFDQHA